MMPGYLVLYATRYALGRMTYAVHDMASYLVTSWPEIDAETRSIIQQDIEEDQQGIRRQQTRPAALGEGRADMPGERQMTPEERAKNSRKLLERVAADRREALLSRCRSGEFGPDDRRAVQRLAKLAGMHAQTWCDERGVQLPPVRQISPEALEAKRQADRDRSKRPVCVGDPLAFEPRENPLDVLEMDGRWVICALLDIAKRLPPQPASLCSYAGQAYRAST